MKHNGLERNIVFVIILYKLMLSMWYVTTSVKQITCETEKRMTGKI